MRSVFLVASMLAATPALAQESTPASTPAPVKEKMICKSQTEIGSLVQKRKMCRTRKQWDEIGLTNRNSARGFIQEQQGRHTVE